MQTQQRRVLVSDHARMRYIGLSSLIGIENFVQGKVDRIIRRHIRGCSPVSEAELLMIRNTKGRAANWNRDHHGAKHVIDRDSWTVFVISPDNWLITCYTAAYLGFIQV